MFREHALESLAEHLERSYGLGDHLAVVAIRCSMERYSLDPSEFLREAFSHLRVCEPSPDFLIRKLRQILKTSVYRHGSFIYVVGRNASPVKIRKWLT